MRKLHKVHKPHNSWQHHGKDRVGEELLIFCPDLDVDLETMSSNPRGQI